MRISGAFADGSVSVGLYATGADASAQLNSLVDLTRSADAAGFDGVSVSEHHAGFSGYLPSPMLVASWLLAESRDLWVGACPVLLPLRPLGILAEGAAWSAIRYPGRFVLGLAPGYVAEDYAIAGASLEGRQQRYWAALPEMVAALTGQATGPLAEDPAIRRCVEAPVPVLTAAAGPLGARRAAQAGAGIILGSFTTPERAAELFDGYIAAGGTGPRVLIRRCWLGPMRSDAMHELLQSYQGAAGSTQFLSDGSADQVMQAVGSQELAESIASVARQAHATAVSLRFHFPGIGGDAVADQISLVGEQALPLLRAQMVHETA